MYQVDVLTDSLDFQKSRALVSTALIINIIVFVWGHMYIHRWPRRPQFLKYLLAPETDKV